jgi:flavin-binding protein dodecin
MSDHVVKVVELLSESDKSGEDAAQQAITKASKTLYGIKSIYIKNFEAKVEGNKIVKYRSTPSYRSCWISKLATQRVRWSLKYPGNPSFWLSAPPRRRIDAGSGLCESPD